MWLDGYSKFLTSTLQWGRVCVLCFLCTLLVGCALISPSSDDAQSTHHEAGALQVPASEVPVPSDSGAPAAASQASASSGGDGAVSKDKESDGISAAPATGQKTHSSKVGASSASEGSGSAGGDTAAKGLAYVTVFDGAVPEVVLTAMKDASLLEKLAKTPPIDMTGLLVRIAADEAEGVRLMRAFGYYEGRVGRRVDTSVQPVKVQLTLEPGPIYHVGPSRIQYKTADGRDAPRCLPPPQKKPEETAAAADTASLPDGASVPVGGEASAAAQDPMCPPVPCWLASVGLAEGTEAVASTVLDAVESIPSKLGELGYPLAKLVSAQYSVNRQSKTLTASVVMEPGPRVRMGAVRMRGKSRVNPQYIEGLRQWQEGRLWDQREVDTYRDMLTGLGLFRSVRMEYLPEGAPIPDADDVATAGVTASLAQSASTQIKSPHNVVGSASDSGGQRPLYDVILYVADAPQRTVGGGIRYDTDRGVGVQAYWEDRNILGNGERLRTELGLWQDTQLVRASFRKPNFYSRKQTLTAEAWARNEDTDAYSQRAIWAGAGVERFLTTHWMASAGLSVEIGDLKDPMNEREPYQMISFPLSVVYNTAGNPLDPIRGVRGQVQVRPTFGHYGEDFMVYPVRGDLSAYYPLGMHDETRPKVILAARVAAGSLLRDDAEKLPASLRWYGGGGGSVRGYAYQSLGPQRNGDPLGGASFVEVSAEARIAVWEEISVVPFIDGGNVYAKQTPDISADGLQWGAGLGLRYQTPIGPLRLDVATPLNPRSEDGPVSFYLSIGQSF